VSKEPRIGMRCTLAPLGEYDGMIYVVAALVRAVATITEATCFTILYSSLALNGEAKQGVPYPTKSAHLRSLGREPVNG